MTTKIFTKEGPLLLAGDEWFIFKKDMIVIMPQTGTRYKVLEVAFMLVKPGEDSQMVSMSQQVFLEEYDKKENK